MSCHRQHHQYRLLEQGHRAFFDRVEGGGSDGWRFHFFCLDPAAASVLSRRRGGSVRSWKCGDIRSQAVRHASAPSTGAYLASQHARWMVGLGLSEGVELGCRTVLSCILIMRMDCLSKRDCVVAFGIDEARRNIRPIKPWLSCHGRRADRASKNYCSRAWVDGHKRIQRPPDDGEEGPGSSSRRIGADRDDLKGRHRHGVALVYRQDR